MPFSPKANLLTMLQRQCYACEFKMAIAGCQLNGIVSTRINYPKGSTNLEEDLKKKNVQDMINNKVISIQVQKVFHPI